MRKRKLVLILAIVVIATLVIITLITEPKTEAAEEIIIVKQAIAETKTIVKQFSASLQVSSGLTEKIELHIYKKNISERSVGLIRELFEVAIKGAEYGNNDMGLDVTNHYFFINKNNVLKGGETWSPNKKSRMGRLKNIGEQLIVLAKSNTELVEFDTKLTKKIVGLTGELK